MIIKLESERLIYRPFDISDAEALFEMDKNPNVHQYLWQKPILKIEEVHQYIENVQKQYQENGIGRFSTILKETNELIGWTGLKYVNDHIENGNTNFYDFGYRLNEKFWNKGFASEATKYWLEYGFKTMNIKTIHAYTHFENGASNRVLEKSGMSFIENYQDKDNNTWKWWKMENNLK